MTTYQNDIMVSLKPGDVAYYVQQMNEDQFWLVVVMTIYQNEIMVFSLKPGHVASYVLWQWGSETWKFAIKQVDENCALRRLQLATPK